jgi:hypothetical protein
MAPTGSFIKEQSVTIPNLFYNLIAWALTEDQSARPISILKVEMSEATDRQNKFGMVTDCSFIKLPVGAMELTTWLLIKAMSGSLLLYNTHVGVYHQLLRLLVGDLTRKHAKTLKK